MFSDNYRDNSGNIIQFEMLVAVGYYILIEESPNHVFYAWGYKENPADLFPTHECGYACNVYGWGDNAHEAVGHMVANTVVGKSTSYYAQGKK